VTAERAADPEWPRCAVGPCQRPAHAHGFCGMHLNRLRRTGGPLGLRGRPTWSGSEVGYTRQHKITVEVRGNATTLPCVWCGAVGRSNGWSFDYAAGDRTRLCPRRGLVYSCSPWDYSVRCGAHHAAWDAINERGAAPILQAWAWLLERMDAHGGEVSSAVIYAEVAAGISRDHLSRGRRAYTDVVSWPASGVRRNTACGDLRSLPKWKRPTRCRRPRRPLPTCYSHASDQPATALPAKEGGIHDDRSDS
jgi:hypothetical protein